MDTAEAARLLAEWDRMGWHRTGTAGDAASLAWLDAAVHGLGLHAAHQPVPLQCRTDVQAYAESEGVRLDGMSLFDAPGTAGPVDGGLTRLDEATGADARIGLVTIRPDAATIEGAPFAALRRGVACDALVACCLSGDGELAPINALEFMQPYGPPTLQLARQHAPVLEAWERKRQRVRVVIDVAHRPAVSANLIVRSGAPTTDGPALLVMTPRTSWHESTSERGGGLLAWLQVLADLPSVGIDMPGPKRQTVLLATTGHEIGHLGVRTFLGSLAAAEKPALALHLGANLGALPDTLTLRGDRPADVESMLRALVEAGYPPESIRVAPIESCVGEARDLVGAGIATVSLVGENSLFHSRGDRWPQAVQLARAVAVARAVGAWVRDRNWNL